LNQIAARDNAHETDNAGNSSPAAENAATPEPAEPAKPSLREMTPEQRADARRTGQISDKDLKKAGFTKEEIAEINDAAKNKAAQADPSRHDRQKVIDSTTGSKKALDEALENLRRNPNSPQAQQAVRDAQRQYDEIQRTARDIKKERRQRDRDGE
jgi:hypothetical protein